MSTIVYKRPSYVDGILKLHSQFKTAFLNFLNFFEFSCMPQIYLSKEVLILVDFGESQPENQLKGYLINQGVLYRFLNVTFDYALLFPVYDHYLNKQVTTGISFNEIQSFFRTREKIIFRFNVTEVSYKKEFFNCTIFNHTETLDNFIIEELGSPYADFSSIDFLNLIDIPSNLYVSYSFVSNNYLSLNNTNDCFCVLYAQDCQRNSPFVIKVLRWFPISNDHFLLGSKNLSNDIFYEMGFIRVEDNNLFDFMMNNNCRLIFARKIGLSIQLLGGIKYLINSGYYFPKCLNKIDVK